MINIYFTIQTDSIVDPEIFQIDYSDNLKEFKNYITEIGTVEIEKNAFKEKFGIDFSFDFYDGELYYIYKNDYNQDFDRENQIELEANSSLIFSDEDVPLVDSKKQVINVKSIDCFEKDYNIKGSFEFVKQIGMLEELSFTKEQFIKIVQENPIFNELKKYLDLDFDIAYITY